MNFQEMEALAKAPQAAVNLHVIQKLEVIDANQVDSALLVGKHERDIEAIKLGCASRHPDKKPAGTGWLRAVGAFLGGLLGIRCG